MHRKKNRVNCGIHRGLQVRDEGWFTARVASDRRRAPKGCCPVARELYQERYEPSFRCCSDRLNLTIPVHLAPLRPRLEGGRAAAGSGWRSTTLRNASVLFVGDSLAEQHFIGFLCLAWAQGLAVGRPVLYRASSRDHAKPGTTWTASVQDLGVEVAYVRSAGADLLADATATGGGVAFQDATALVIGGWHMAAPNSKSLGAFLDDLARIRGNPRDVTQVPSFHFCCLQFYITCFCTWPNEKNACVKLAPSLTFPRGCLQLLPKTRQPRQPLSAGTLVVEALPSHFPGGRNLIPNHGDSKGATRAKQGLGPASLYPEAKLDGAESGLPAAGSFAASIGLAASPPPKSLPTSSAPPWCDAVAINASDPNINSAVAAAVVRRADMGFRVLEVAKDFRAIGSAHVGMLQNKRDCLHWFVAAGEACWRFTHACLDQALSAPLIRCIAPGILDALALKTLVALESLAMMRPGAPVGAAPPFNGAKEGIDTGSSSSYQRGHTNRKKKEKKKSELPSFYRARPGNTAPILP